MVRRTMVGKIGDDGGVVGPEGFEETKVIHESQRQGGTTTAATVGADCCVTSHCQYCPSSVWCSNDVGCDES